MHEILYMSFVRELLLCTLNSLQSLKSPTLLKGQNIFLGHIGLIPERKLSSIKIAGVHMVWLT